MDKKEKGSIQELTYEEIAKIALTVDKIVHNLIDNLESDIDANASCEEILSSIKLTIKIIKMNLKWLHQA